VVKKCIEDKKSNRKRNEDEELSVLVFLEIDREDEQFT
jgi:hypothetical protein